MDADLNKAVPVSLNAQGQVVKGTAGQSGFVGVVCLTGSLKNVSGGTNWRGSKRAGDIVDVMQNGEIVELTGLAAGRKYYAAADGNSIISDAVPANVVGLPMVGWTVEASRLVTRCQTALPFHA